MTALSGSLVQPNNISLDLGFDVPMSVYHPFESWRPERVGALALYCSDGRWGEAFDEFCHQFLHIPRYDRWAVPGGPACLAPRAVNEALRGAAREQLDFLVQAHDLKRIVLITHYGCAWYSHGHGRSAKECLTFQREDVRAAAAELRRWYAGVRVEAYLAMVNMGWFSFHPLDG
jgi:hypothetical protein